MMTVRPVTHGLDFHRGGAQGRQSPRGGAK